MADERETDSFNFNGKINQNSFTLQIWKHTLYYTLYYTLIHTAGIHNPCNLPSDETKLNDAFQRHIQGELFAYWQFVHKTWAVLDKTVNMYIIHLFRL